MNEFAALSILIDSDIIGIISYSLMGVVDSSNFSSSSMA
jgi:hypothetical protein